MKMSYLPILILISLISIALSSHPCLKSSKDCNSFFPCCWKHCNNQLRESSCGNGAKGLYGFCHCHSVKNSDVDLKKYRASGLEAHNRYRKMHGVDPVVMTKKLNAAAQKYAKTLATKKKALVHSDLPFGENLGVHNLEIDGEEAVKYWYDEIEYYDYKKPGFYFETSHFTQVVWNDTKRIGMGVYVDEVANNVYVVAHYDPPGNIRGQFTDNVPKPKGN